MHIHEHVTNQCTRKCGFTNPKLKSHLGVRMRPIAIPALCMAFRWAPITVVVVRGRTEGAYFAPQLFRVGGRTINH